MRIKQRLDDFRVRELLADGVLQPSGEHRVYRVTKRKLTSLEAARELAAVAGVPAGEVALAGLKDRQGVTVQYMSLRRGREVNLRALDLTVESVGFADEALESRHSLGNAFELTLRGLVQEDLDALRENVPLVRDCGVVNYFDEQRFGNLRHNQGWIAELLMRGEREEALRRLLASLSDHDDAASHGFKRGLLEAWGDWSRCRELAGRFGEHHSVFEYLKKNPEDFGGAFYHIASRLRLIHLYAFQSHVWNRAVADFVRKHAPEGERVVLTGVEGPLVYPSRPLALPPGATFRLPGPGFEDVRDPEQRGLLEDALARERLTAADFRIDGVPGFQLKGEDRDLLISPRHLRVRPPERDSENFDAFSVKVRFELPRGAYATLVVRRLLSSPTRAAGRDRGADRGQRDGRSRLGREGDSSGGTGRERPFQGAGGGAGGGGGAGAGGDSAARPRGGDRGGRGEAWNQSSAGDAGHQRAHRAQRADRQGRDALGGRVGRADRFGPGRPEDSQGREDRPRGLPQHSESGESLAPKPQPWRGRDGRDEQRPGGREGRGEWRSGGARPYDREGARGDHRGGTRAGGWQGGRAEGRGRGFSPHSGGGYAGDRGRGGEFRRDRAPWGGPRDQGRDSQRFQGGGGASGEPARGDFRRDDRGRGDFGRDDRGRDHWGRDDRGRGDFRRDDRGRGDFGRDDRGRTDPRGLNFGAARDAGRGHAFGGDRPPRQEWRPYGARPGYGRSDAGAEGHRGEGTRGNGGDERRPWQHGGRRPHSGGSFPGGRAGGAGRHGARGERGQAGGRPDERSPRERDAGPFPDAPREPE